MFLCSQLGVTTDWFPGTICDEGPQSNCQNWASQNLEERYSVKANLARNVDQDNVSCQPDAEEGGQEGSEDSQRCTPTNNRFGDNANYGCNEPVNELCQRQREMPAKEVPCHDNGIR